MEKQTSEKTRTNASLAAYQQVTVIGAGAIGLSWTAVFLANGLKVTVNDQRADLEEATFKAIESVKPTLQALGYNTNGLEKNLSFEKDLAKAIQHADVIQENGPEDIVFKQDLYVQIEANMPLVSSSTSGIPATKFSEKMKDASRVLIGHPFNPPHLIV